MAKNNFIQGAFILLISGSIVRVLGLIYQVLIVRIIGTEAIGLYNMVHPLFIMGLVLATAGLPPAISKLVSQYFSLSGSKNALKILKIALTLLFFLGLFWTIIIIIISPFLLKYLYVDPRVKFVLLMMLPCITISALGSAFRGYFQGLQNMTPTAVAQCLEQFTRIICGLLLALKLKNYGIEIVAIALAFSMLLGEIAGTLFLGKYFLRQRNNLSNLAPPKQIPALSFRKIIFELFSFGVPTTCTRLVSSLTLTFEASLIPLLLQKIGFTINQATAIYGQFSGVCLTILSVPTILTFSLAVSLVPAISEAEVQGATVLLRSRSSEALRLTFIFGLPAVVVLLFIPGGLSSLLFKIPEAASTLRILGCGGLFLYLSHTASGILQGLGLVKKILFNSSMGSLIKILSIFYLVPLPALNINGAALGFACSYLVVCFLNLNAIRKTIGLEINQKQIFLPFLAALIMAVSLLLTHQLFINSFSADILTLISLVISGGLYLFLIILWGQLNPKLFLNKKTKD